jgi:hypothetical protein
MKRKNIPSLHAQAMTAGGRIMYLWGRCDQEGADVLRATSFDSLSLSLTDTLLRQADAPTKPTFTWSLRLDRLASFPLTHDIERFANSLPTLRRHSFINPLLWIKWYGVQGNMEFSTEELRALAGLGTGLAMDYVYISGDSPGYPSE